MLVPNGARSLHEPHLFIIFACAANCHLMLRLNERIDGSLPCGIDEISMGLCQAASQEHSCLLFILPFLLPCPPALLLLCQPPGHASRLPILCLIDHQRFTLCNSHFGSLISRLSCDTKCLTKRASCRVGKAMRGRPGCKLSLAARCTASSLPVAAPLTRLPPPVPRLALEALLALAAALHAIQLRLAETAGLAGRLQHEDWIGIKAMK